MKHVILTAILLVVGLGMSAQADSLKTNESRIDSLQLTIKSAQAEIDSINAAKVNDELDSLELSDLSFYVGPSSNFGATSPTVFITGNFDKGFALLDLSGNRDGFRGNVSISRDLGDNGFMINAGVGFTASSTANANQATAFGFAGVSYRMYDTQKFRVIPSVGLDLNRSMYLSVTAEMLVHKKIQVLNTMSIRRGAFNMGIGVRIPIPDSFNKKLTDFSNL